MFSIFGLLGQTLYNTLDVQHTLDTQTVLTDSKMKKRNWMQGLADMKWSPMKVLSDEEYERMLSERLLRVNAEIAIVEEGIEQLKSNPKKDGSVKGVDGESPT